MNQINLNFRLSDEEIRHLKFPVQSTQTSIQEYFLYFREKVFVEILHNKTRNPDLITIIKHSQWAPDYSQIFYDGIFQGHLYEDFISFNFKFIPAP